VFINNKLSQTYFNVL